MLVTTTIELSRRRSCAPFRTLWTLCLLLLGASVVQGQDAPTAAPEPVSFLRDVAPVLVQRCLACHGAQDAKGDFQLHTFAKLQAPGESGSASITPGKPEESQLYLLVAETDADVRMPKEADPLSAEQVALVRRWIEEGARFEGASADAPLASIAARPPLPAAPARYPRAIPVTAVAFDPTGQELVVSGYREVTIWSAADGRLLRRIGNIAERTYGLAYHPGGSLLAVASGVPGQLGEVKLIDPQQGSVVRELGTTSDVAYAVAFSPDGNRVAAAAADRSIRVYNVADGTQSLLIEDHADWVHSVAWNVDGTRLVSASRDKTCKVFDAASGDALATFSGHGQTVFSAVFSVDPAQVVSGGADNTVRIWKADDGAQAAEIGGIGDEVHRVLVRGGQIFVASADKSVRQFKGDTRELAREFAGHADWVYALDVHEGTSRIASGSYDGEVRIWNLADGAVVTQFLAAPGYVAPESRAAAGTP